MPTIPLKDAMIVWTANQDPWTKEGNWAPAGSIAVVHWPDDQNAWSRFPASYGACTGDYREGDDDYRLQSLANLVGQFRTEDGMNMEHVFEALSVIEGIERIKEFIPRLRR